VGEFTDVNPWNGWEITHGAGDTTVGPLLTPVGPAFVQSVAAWMKVIVDGDTILQATVPGRYRHIELGARAIRLVLPPIPADDDRKRWLAFPQMPRDRVATARLGDQALTPELMEEGAIGCYFRLPPTAAPQPFELLLP